MYMVNMNSADTSWLFTYYSPDNIMLQISQTKGKRK